MEEKTVKTVQDLANIINHISILNRKENGTYNTVIASLTGLLLTELESISDFLQTEGYKNLKEWELLSETTVNNELKNIHHSISLNDLLNSN